MGCGFGSYVLGPKSMVRELGVDVDCRAPRVRTAISSVLDGTAIERSEPLLRAAAIPIRRSRIQLTIGEQTHFGLFYG